MNRNTRNIIAGLTGIAAAIDVIASLRDAHAHVPAIQHDAAHRAEVIANSARSDAEYSMRKARSAKRAAWLIKNCPDAAIAAANAISDAQDAEKRRFEEQRRIDNALRLLEKKEAEERIEAKIKESNEKARIEKALRLLEKKEAEERLPAKKNPSAKPKPVPPINVNDDEEDEYI